MLQTSESFLNYSKPCIPLPSYISLITQTKGTIFIHYTYLPYFSFVQDLFLFVQIQFLGSIYTLLLFLYFLFRCLLPFILRFTYLGIRGLSTDFVEPYFCLGFK